VDDGGSEGLHSIHSACDTCHEGEYAKGTVASSACIVCHPFTGSGQCNMVILDVHDTACTVCHAACASGDDDDDDDSNTTTTAATKPCFAAKIMDGDGS